MTEITVELEPGELLCRVSAEIARSEDWQECQAFRFVRVGPDEVRLQIALDLDTLTAPEAPALTGQVCTCSHAAGDHKSARRSLAGALQNGTSGLGHCLIDGCTCRQYVQAPELQGGDVADA